MKRICLFTIALAFTVPAVAQTAPPDATTQTLGADWSARSALDGHILDGINKLVVEKQALMVENAKLKKELEEATAKLAPSAADKK